MLVHKCDVCGAIYERTDGDNSLFDIYPANGINTNDRFYEEYELCPDCTKRVREFIEVMDEYGRDNVTCHIMKTEEK